MIHKWSTALERSVNILLEGLNRFNGAPTSPIVQMTILKILMFADKMSA